MVRSAIAHSQSAPLPAVVDDLISRQPAGHSLLGPFYSNRDVYHADLEMVWREGWLFAGHSCEIPNAGDYFAVNVDADSILVVRDQNGVMNAVHNVCRHRGSQLCDEEAGRVKKLICPYHRWTYDLEGKLLAAPGMQELDKEELALKPVALREVEGLIFISLADEPLDFDSAQECFSIAKSQGFRRAKIAKAVDYLVKANWKLVWENNRECFHCNANHPQYIKANFDHFNVDDTTPEVRKQIQEVVRRSEAKWAADGLAVSHKQTGMTTFPDAERNIWYSANRTTLVDGYVSETMDGKQAAPLMGDYRDADVGTLRMRALPNFWNHSSCDHGVSTRLLPLGPELTAIRVWWLVDEKAIEGRDYDLAKLMPFWQLTSEQDWVICERQQRGVNSSAYVPGPYSTYKEYNVEAFVRWYLNQLKARA
jgi:Rieske 2Fe-2S family protein